MAKEKQYKPSTTNTTRRRKPITEEAREAYMVSLAMDRAEQQLLDGTASSQVITHFLKLGTAQAKLELEKTKKENKVLDAKAKAIESSEEMKILYDKAIKAMRNYAGYDSEDAYEY